MLLLAYGALAATYVVLAPGTELRAGAGPDATRVPIAKPTAVEVVVDAGATLRVRAPVERSGCVAALDALGGVEWVVEADAASLVLVRPFWAEVDGSTVAVAAGTPVRRDGDALVTMGGDIEVRLPAAGVAAAPRVEATPGSPGPLLFAPQPVRPYLVPISETFRIGAGTLFEGGGVTVTALAPTTVLGRLQAYRHKCVGVASSTRPPPPPAGDPGPGGGLVGGIRGGVAGSEEVYVRAGAPLVWPDGSSAGALREAATWAASPRGPWCAVAMSEGGRSPRVCVDPDYAVWLGRVRELSAKDVRLQRRPLPAMPRDVSCSVRLLLAPSGELLEYKAWTCSRGQADLDVRDVDPGWLVHLVEWRFTLPPTEGQRSGARVTVTVTGG